MRIAILTLSFLILGCNPKFIKNSDLENKIFSSLEIEKDTFKIGEPVLVKFTILNKSDQEIFVDNRPYKLYIDGAKVEAFKVIVQNEKNELIMPTHSQVTNAYGRYGIVKVNPFKTCEFQFHLSEYADIKEAGNYKLQVSKKMNIYLIERKRNNFKNYINVNLESNLHFLIVEN